MKEIPLTGKYGKGKVILVDDDDFDFVRQYKAWFDGKYVLIHHQKKGKDFRIALSRVLMSTPDDQYCYHQNGNKFDFQKHNLANLPRTSSPNRRNWTGKTGLQHNKKANRWVSTWREDGKRKSKNFPYTPKGKQQAIDLIDEMTVKHMRPAQIIGEVNYKSLLAETDYLGVEFYPDKNLYQAYYYRYTKKHTIGYYSTELEAAYARDKFLLREGSNFTPNISKVSDMLTLVEPILKENPNWANIQD